MPNINLHDKTAMTGMPTSMARMTEAGCVESLRPNGRPNGVGLDEMIA